MNEVRISQGNLNKIEVKPKKTQEKILKKKLYSNKLRIS